MRETLKRRPFVIAVLVISILLAAGVGTFASPCIHADGSSAACHTAAIAGVCSGVLSAVVALAALFARGGKLAGGMMLVSAVAGLFAASSPGVLFGLCMMQTMRCWTVMRPFALVCGGVLFVCALVAAITLLRERGGGVS